LLCEWKNGSRQWIDLKDMQECNPVQVAEYAVSRGLDDEAAFEWWVPYTLRKQDVFISAINSRYKATTHKYGIEVPRTITEVLRFD